MIYFGKNGYLKIIIGSMFSGKTSELLKFARYYKLCNIKCCVINYHKNQRYHKILLSSHDKNMIPCIKLSSLDELITDTEYLKTTNVFLIDEGQFFPNLYNNIKILLEKYKKTIYIFGLDGDYKRQKFGQILDLIPLCDEIEKKKALCLKCKNGNQGIFTQRLSNEVEQTIIGSENYISVCRECYNKKDVYEKTISFS